MQQQGRGTKLERLVLQFIFPNNNHFYYFQVNPESYKETYPQRSTAFKTRSNFVVEDFGPGPGTITFSVTTGFRRVNGRDGMQRMAQLQSDLEEFSSAGSVGEGANPNRRMILYNNTDEKEFEVALSPEGYSISRSVEQPLLFKYEIELFNLGDPTDSRRDGPTTGNRFRTQTSSNVNPNSIESNPTNNANIIENNISNPPKNSTPKTDTTALKTYIDDWQSRTGR